MWEPSIQSTQAHIEVAVAKIVFDKFHVAKHLYAAVDRIRRTEHRTLKQAGEDCPTGTQCLWLMRPTDMAARAGRPIPHSAVDGPQGGTDLGSQGALPAVLRLHLLWCCRKCFSCWFWRAIHSRLRPMAAVAKLIRWHLPNVLT